MKTLIITYLIFLLMFAGCLVKPAKDNSPRNAYYISQYFVKDKLLTPATVNFPSYNKIQVRSTPMINKGYKVEAYFDAQNYYGAVVRTHYKCIVQYESGSTWNLISINFE